MALLKKENRTLQTNQKEYFSQQFQTANSPLYVVVVAQELKNWKSHDTKQELEPTQKGIIKEFIESLYNVHHHNKEFVHRVLCYIYASRDGLSENELLQLIAVDKEFIQKMAPETWHENPNKELPLVHWSRLQTQLKPFLSSKTQDAEELIYFFHREFEDVIKELPCQIKEHEAIIEANQALIQQNQDRLFSSNRWGKLYATLITEYELRYQDEVKFKKYSEFIASLKNEEWIEIYFITINTFGIQYKEQNEMIQAMVYFKTILFLAESLYMSNSVKWFVYFINGLNNLSFVYKLQENCFDEALRLENRALALLEENPKKDSEMWAYQYALILNAIASSYKIKNDSINALKLATQAWKTLDEYHGKNPKMFIELYIKTLNNLAVFYQKNEDIENAIKFGRQTLEERENLYNENPKKWVREYITSLNNLGAMYYHKKNSEEAIGFGRKAYEIVEKLYEENSKLWVEMYASICNSLASYYELSGNKLDFSQAIELEEKVLFIYEDFHQKNPQKWAKHYILVLSNLISLYQRTNSQNKLLALLEKSRIVYEELYTSYDEELVKDYNYALNKLASFYVMGQKFDEAKELMEKALSITKEYYKNNATEGADVYTANLSMLANMYFRLKKCDQALDLISNAYKISSEILGKENYQTQSIEKTYQFIKDACTYDQDFTTIMHIANLIASNSRSREITPVNLKQSIVVVKLDEYSRNEFAKIFGEHVMNKVTQEYDNNEDFKTLLELAKSLPRLPYSQDLKPLVEQLKKEFGDKKICRLR